jgi:hypothetical protein
MVKQLRNICPRWLYSGLRLKNLERKIKYQAGAERKRESEHRIDGR